MESGATLPLRARLNRVAYFLRLPRVGLGMGLFAVLLVLVALPCLKLLAATLTWDAADIRLSPAAQPGALTLFHWMRVFSSDLSAALFYRPLLHSLVTSVSIGLLSVGLGTGLAWLTTRTDLPGRGLVAAMATVPYILPSYTYALAWLTVFRTERLGGVAGLFRFTAGADPPEWLAYGFVPIVVTLTLHYAPFTYLLVAGALASIDAQMEEAGEVLGASRATILRRITFPLVIPALLSGFILTFSRALGTFGTPYFLGAPVRYFTVPTTIYSSMVTRTFATGYILAVVLIAVSALVIYANQRVIGTRKSYVTIGGKGFRSAQVHLGSWRFPAALASWGLVLVAVAIPLVLLAWQTLMRYPDDYSLGNLTLHYWIGASDPRFAEGEMGILRNGSILGGAWNSIKLSVIVAALGGLLGILIGYVVVGGRGGCLARLLEQQAFLPYLIPSIAFGALYLSIFARSMGPLPALYGTFLILVLACVGKNLPFSARAGTSAMLQVAGELEEAAVVAGASWIRRFGRIVLPLSLRGSLAGFLLIFVTAMRELSLIILLVTPETRTLTTMTFRYTEQGYAQFADAIILLIVALVLAGDLLARRLGRVEPRT
ncbi:MAG TPA: iron ABC transporter permease [Candidatus Methylomirabilis sp.]|nr:iron ABC transporter permease [Candidatus Methylomirabilis sp.]